MTDSSSLGTLRPSARLAYPWRLANVHCLDMLPAASNLSALLSAYDPTLPLERASTIPASWYTDARFHDLEQRAMFAQAWQMVARIDQLADVGDYVTGEIAGDPVIVVRGRDGVVRGFFNVCRHHAAAVMTAAAGNASCLVCPYHGWAYALDGSLEATPQLGAVCDFDPRENGLLPLEVATWERWVFARVAPGGPSLQEFLGNSLIEQVAGLSLGTLRFFERRTYQLACNWKVYIDNYLDGGYHVPHLHHGLDSVLEPGRYTIYTGRNHCVQSSAIRTRDAGNPTAEVRQGPDAHYLWLYPNFMINWYEGVVDTNFIRPLSVDRSEVVFDYWFADTSEAERARNEASIAVSERIQDEDAGICASVQRGLRSRAYNTGRLSARRETGEHLFHRLLHADLTRPC